jgi:hypothetical protein
MDAVLPSEPQSTLSRLLEPVRLAADDDSFYRRRFQEESVRLFGNDVDELESLAVPCNASGKLTES